jgi:hypothetical protein
VAAAAALAATSARETQPVWSVSQASVFSPEHSMLSLIAKQRKGEAVGFKEVVSQFYIWTGLLKVMSSND